VRRKLETDERVQRPPRQHDGCHRQCDVQSTNFLEQFGKDQKDSEVSDLSQIKWIFDGKKLSQQELTDAIKKMIDEWKVPKELVKKYRPLDEDVSIFKADLISIFIAK
jgi:hypothetical protein